MSTADDYDSLAGKIVDWIMSEDRRSDPPAVPEGVSVADVERDAREFRQLRDLHRALGQDMLVLVTKGRSPAPFLFRALFGDNLSDWPGTSAILGYPWYYRLPPDEYPWFRLSDANKKSLQAAQAARVAEYPEGTAKLITQEEATNGFIKGARGFVRERLRFGHQSHRDTDEKSASLFMRLRKGLGGGPTNIPACLFTVSTNNPGLQVLWTPAYAHAQNYFGSPTTPVKAPLQAGSYRFGVLGGAYVTPQWSLPVHTLPGTPSAHIPV